MLLLFIYPVSTDVCKNYWRSQNGVTKQKDINCSFVNEVFVCHTHVFDLFICVLENIDPLYFIYGTGYIKILHVCRISKLSA